MTHQNTAILYFSRSASAEVEKKCLGNGKHQSKLLADFLIKQVKKIAKKTGFTVFHITERQQHGVSFGERFANAFEYVFEKGYLNVISIGNDCLSLTTEDLLFTSSALSCSNAVIGPSVDGGAYLIGLNKNSFNKIAFQNLEWQNNTTLSSLISYLDTVGSNLSILSEKTDVDHMFNWKEVVKTIPIHYSEKILELLFSKVEAFIPLSLNPLNRQYLVFSNSLRAPPQ